MKARYFERYFFRDVNVEEVDLSMGGYEFPWNEYWNRPEMMMVAQTYLGVSRRL